jgi:hypothetical protein
MYREISYSMVTNSCYVLLATVTQLFPYLNPFLIRGGQNFASASDTGGCNPTTTCNSLYIIITIKASYLQNYPTRYFIFCPSSLFSKFSLRADFWVVVLSEENIFMPQINYNICRRIYALITSSFPNITLS